MGGAFVKARENGARRRWHGGDLVVVAGETADDIKRVEEHQRRELNLVLKVTTN